MASNSNPWTLNASYMSVGNLRNITKIAERNAKVNETLFSTAENETMVTMPIRTPLPLTYYQNVHNQKAIQESDNINHASRKTCTSLCQISLLKEISRLDDLLSKFQEEKESNSTLVETADLTDMKSLDLLLSKLESLYVHLQNLIDKRGILISRLKEAHKDHMTINAEFHRDLTEGFPMIAKQLASLNPSLQSIIWTKQFSLEQSNLSSVCKNITSRLADLQCYYQTLDESRAVMRMRVRRYKQ